MKRRRAWRRRAEFSRTSSILVPLAMTLGWASTWGCKQAKTRDGPPVPHASAVASLAPALSVAAFPRPGPDDPKLEPAASGSSASMQAAPAITLKLLDAGQAPRRKLRYAWHLEQKEQLTMDLRTAASTDTQGTKQSEFPLPSVRVVIAIDPQSLSPEGDLRYVWRIASAAVDAADDTPSQVADGMRAEVADIGHLSGSAVVTSRGLSKEVSVAPGGGAGETGSGQMAEQIRQTLRDIAAPLPEEEVGVGARWSKASQLDEKDARITQTDSFRLIDLQGERGTLDDALAQTAPPQPLRAPGMPPGAHARMESMLASGEAKVRFDLSRLVPQTAFDGTTTMVLSGQSAGDPARNMRMTMHVFIAIAGSRR